MATDKNSPTRGRQVPQTREFGNYNLEQRGAAGVGSRETKECVVIVGHEDREEKEDVDVFWFCG